MKCPGQDSRYWDQKAIYEVKCPQCRATVEFFKDESKRKCQACGHLFINPQLDLGCAAYCKFAEQCLGDLSPEIQAKRDDMLKDKVALEVKRYFGQDFTSIAKALQVATYVQKILFEENADPAIVITAGYLQEVVRQQGLQQAREILERLGASTGLVQAVMDLLKSMDQDTPGQSNNLDVLQDAVLLDILRHEKEQGQYSEQALHQYLENGFRTKTGQDLAKEVLSAGTE